MLRYKEIKQALLQEISKYMPGERLPSRPVLCRKLDTTRTTLDKAIRERDLCRGPDGRRPVTGRHLGRHRPQCYGRRLSRSGSWGGKCSSALRDQYYHLQFGQ